MSEKPKAGGLTHLDAAGHAHMVDVGAKPVTARVAVATGHVRCAPATVELLRAGELAKGDALAVARIAGIAGAKRTPDLIPLCHPIAITAVDLSVDLVPDGVAISANVRTAERTGIEMEALTAVSVAALTVIDMVKGVDRGAHITDIRVERKEGGASGSWVRGEALRAAASAAGAQGAAATSTPDGASMATTSAPDGVGEPSAATPGAPSSVSRTPLAECAAAVITVSDRSAAGEREDLSGPMISAALRRWGATVSSHLVPDDVEQIRGAIRDALSEGARLIVTTGGTGIASRDVTPEAVTPLLDRQLPGLAQEVRATGVGRAPGALLSRGVAGLIDRALIVTLPGSVGGVQDGLTVLGGVVGHVLDQLADGDHASGHGEIQQPLDAVEAEENR